jgi:fluoride exporter
VTRDPLRARDLAAVSLGGALGALMRWTVGEVGPGGSWSTLAVNVVGCLVLGALPVVGAVRRSPTLARFLGPGVLAGFTTVSAMAVETVDLADTGQVPIAFAYAAGTLALCLLAASAGRALVRHRTEVAP